MIVDKKEKYTLIKTGQHTINEVITELEKRYEEFRTEHLIFDFSEKINIKIEDLLLFLKISKQHRENGTSFVLVCKGINFDDAPEEINIVPTLTEALDILEMEAIERDLGF